MNAECNTRRDNATLTHKLTLQSTNVKMIINFVGPAHAELDGLAIEYAGRMIRGAVA